MPSPSKTFSDWYAQGYKKYLAKDLRGANACYERALAALGPHGEHPELLSLLGNLTQNYLELGEEEPGWRYFDLCFRKADEAVAAGRKVHPNTWHQLAWILYERGSAGHAEQALELVQRSLDLDVQLIALDTKMRLLLKLEREAEARQVAIAALTRDFDHRDFQDVKKRFGLQTREAVRRAAGRRSIPATPPSPMPSPMPSRPAAPKGWSVPAEAWDDADTESVEDPAELAALGLPLAKLPPGEARLDALQREARKQLHLLFSDHGISREVGKDSKTARLMSLLDDDDAGAYVQLDAALALALRGERRAIRVLRRVFDEPMFARTNSCHEYGYASVGLALLDDLDSLDRVRRAPRINMSKELCELALAIMTQRALLDVRR